MAKRKMKRFLRRPQKQKNKGLQKWKRLYDLALERAEAVSDPRVQDLRHYASDPEKALRSLSIISETDIDREFVA